MAQIIEEVLQGSETLPELQAHAASQAGRIRSTEDPIVITTDRVGPESLLPFVQMYAEGADSQPSQLAFLDGMDCG